MSIEGEQTESRNRLVSFVESNNTIKRASALVGAGGLIEIGAMGDQLGSDSLTKVVAITALAFVNSAIFQVMENAEKVK